MTCFNNNFPHMRRVAEAPGDTVHRRRLRGIAETIHRRTGLRCCYDMVRKGLFFHYGHEPDFGVLRLAAFNPDGSEKRYADHEVDDAVRFVQLGKLSAARKARMAAQHAQREQWAKDEDTERFLAERRPGAIDYDGFLMRKRRGTAKVIDTGVISA